MPNPGFTGRASANLSGTQSARPAVLVTGGSGGIGRAISHAFGQTGWYVGVHYCRNKTAAQATLQDVISPSGTGDIFQADLREAEAIQRMITHFGQQTMSASSTAMICAAGIGASSLLLRQRDEAWADLVAINLTGTFRCLRAMAPLLIERGGGSIIVLGSYAGFHGGTGQAAYAASKARPSALVNSAALEWGDFNIRVNLVLPGWQETEMSREAMPEADGWQDHALHRPPSRHEVAGTILHLAQLHDVSAQVWNCDSRNLQ